MDLSAVNFLVQYASDRLVPRTFDDPVEQIRHTFTKMYPYSGGGVMKSGADKIARFTEANMLLVTEQRLDVLAAIVPEVDDPQTNVCRVKAGTRDTVRGRMAEIVMCPPEEKFIVIEFQRSTRPFENSIMFSTSDVVRVGGVQTQVIYRSKVKEWLQVLAPLGESDRKLLGQVTSMINRPGSTASVVEKNCATLVSKYPAMFPSIGACKELAQGFPSAFGAEWKLTRSVLNAVKEGVVKPVGEFEFLKDAK